MTLIGEAAGQCGFAQRRTLSDQAAYQCVTAESGFVGQRSQSVRGSRSIVDTRACCSQTRRQCRSCWAAALHQGRQHLQQCLFGAESTGGSGSEPIKQCPKVHGQVDVAQYGLGELGVQGQAAIGDVAGQLLHQGRVEIKHAPTSPTVRERGAIVHLAWVDGDQVASARLYGASARGRFLCTALNESYAELVVGMSSKTVRGIGHDSLYAGVVATDQSNLKGWHVATFEVTTGAPPAAIRDGRVAVQA